MIAVIFTQVAQGADDQHEKDLRLFKDSAKAIKFLTDRGFTRATSFGRFYKYNGFHDEIEAEIIDKVSAPGFAFQYIEIGDKNA